MTMHPSFIFIGFLLAGSLAQSAVAASVTTGSPIAGRDFTLALSDPTARAMGSVCFATDVGAETLPCNPAFIAQDRAPDFRAQFFFGNNVSYVSLILKILSGNGSTEDIHDLFDQTRSSEMEAQIDAGYRAPTWGVAVMPSRWIYSSRIRNVSLPVISVLAAQEKAVRVQMGSYVENDWTWGLQLRAVNRRFVIQTFTLSDLLSEGNRELFAAQEQNALYVEPGLLKEWPDEWMRPQLSLSVMQWGVVSRKVDEFPASPEFHMGGAIRPDIVVGNWEIGLDARLRSNMDSAADLLRFGTAYQYGVTHWAASASASDYNLGFQVRYGRLQAGLTYVSNLIENQVGNREWIRTTYLHLGYD